MAVISLLTDFGLEDEYVGVMKGVILSIDPEARMVDITHGVAPQNLIQGAYTLAAAYPFFPPGTIHTAVVDPGVGTDRGILAAAAGGHTFLVPDNGLLSVVMDRVRPERIIRVTESRYFLKTISRTFHGRDIFAPVAAHLSTGLPLTDLGPAVAAGAVNRLDPPTPVRRENGELVGHILTADRFGNLMTDVDAAVLAGTDLRLAVAGRTLHGLSDSYAAVPPGHPLLILGSRGYLEISINGGNARRELELEPGQEILFQTRQRSCD